MSVSVSKIFGLVILAATSFGMTSCKPTEKNYKAAYDAALGKREAARAELGIDLPEGAIQQVDGPQLKKVDGVDVYVLNKRIVPVEEGMKLPGNYNVVVGVYKMNTNSLAQSEDLKAEGYEAFAAKDSSGMHYTVAGSFPTMKEAIAFYQAYKSKSGRVYVGLPESPIILYSPM